MSLDRLLQQTCTIVRDSGGTVTETPVPCWFSQRGRGQTVSRPGGQVAQVEGTVFLAPETAVRLTDRLRVGGQLYQVLAVPPVGAGSYRAALVQGVW